MSFRSSDRKTGLEVYKSPNEHTVPPPGYSGSGQTTDEPTTVWGQYIDKAHHHDKDLVDDANNTVEVLLIFAGLFSAVVSAFIGITYPMLKPDPGDTLSAILLQLQGQTNTPTFASFAAGSSDDFKPPHYAIRVNCFLFVGLFISIMVALLSILVKQWTRAYQRDLAGVSSQHLRARIRHFRYHGVERWRLVGIVGSLSIAMHGALFVSAIGIIDLLFSTARTVGIVALSFFLVGATFFVGTSLHPLFSLDSPFRSPLSGILSNIKRVVIRPDYTRRKKGTEDEGLDDNIEQSQGKGPSSEADSIVRTQLHLDLDILSGLMTDADKSTERWMLDLCFDKLPSLNNLARQSPSLILKCNTLIDVYTFLAKGCVVTNKHGNQEVNPNRIPRARQLCKFLAWFLSLQRNADERQRLADVLTNEKIDPNILPTALAKDIGIDDSVAPAAAALGRLSHLYNVPTDETTCKVCLDGASELRKQIPPQPTHSDTLVSQVTNFIITRSDCLLFWNWAEEIDWKTDQNLARDANADDHLALLKDVVGHCLPTKKEKELWIKELKTRAELAAKPLVDFWFDPLIAAIERITVTRSPSPSLFAGPQATPVGSPGGMGGNPARGAANGNAIFAPNPQRPPVFPNQNTSSLFPTSGSASGFPRPQVQVQPNQPLDPRSSVASNATTDTASTMPITPRINVTSPTLPPSD